jgi:transcriptional regulator GlxA family with amidase domain
VNSRALLRCTEAIAHLESHFADPVSLEQLTRLARMSKRSFIRLFQAAAGNPPIARMSQLRLNFAAKLLRQTDKTITEIAYEAGFNDSNYFARQFRKVIGLSPRTCRAHSHSIKTNKTRPLVKENVKAQWRPNDCQ